MEIPKHKCSILPILGNLPPHIKCSEAEEDGLVCYTIFWERVVCVMQKDGPVTIMDYREKPGRQILYKSLESALDPLGQLLREVATLQDPLQRKEE
jgi:hypothetical protein